MSKADIFLEECKKNVGNWTCSLHTTNSNQPAAIFREVKKEATNLKKSLLEDGENLCIVLSVNKKHPIINY